MTLLRFITGVRPVDGTPHEVAKQPPNNSASHTLLQSGDTASSHGRILLPSYEKTGISIDIHCAGQSTNGVHSKRVGFFLVGSRDK